ncbi:MAG: DUF4136 domain-containing protein [Enhygromyxa sp.]
MNKKILLCASLAFTLIAACKEDDQQELPEEAVIGAVHDMSADFSSYQSFDVVGTAEIPAERAAAPMAYLDANRDAVTQSIIREMENRGYVRDQTDPDLRISPLIRLEEIVEAEGEAVEPHWYDYYYGWYWGYADPWYDEDVTGYGAGTLIIDAVDVGGRESVEDDKLVFRGYATEILPSEPSDVSERISEAVAEIFEHWPSVTRS